MNVRLFLAYKMNFEGSNFHGFCRIINKPQNKQPNLICGNFCQERYLPPGLTGNNFVTLMFSPVLKIT